MKILVINAGSSSLKYQLIDMDNEQMLAKGNCEKIGLEMGIFGHKTADGREKKIEICMKNHTEAFEQVKNALLDSEVGVIKDLSEVSAIGHRIVQGGSLFSESVLVDDKVIEGDFLYGMVSNTMSVGRFNNFPPGNPDLSDGLLEVTLISPVRDVKDMEEFSRALLMTNPSILNSMMTTFSTAKVKFTAAQELRWTLDGEAGGAHQVVEVEAVHNAYTIIYGPEKPQ